MGQFKEYYKFSPDLSIEEIAKRWKENKEMIGDAHIHGWIGLREVWPYREYTWTRDTSRPGYAKVDGEYQEMKGPEKWDYLKEDMKENGWREQEQPIILQVGRDGNVKVSEGNHRLAIAKEIGMKKVPVRFDFRQNVRDGEKIAQRVASRFLKKAVNQPDQWFMNKEYHPLEGGFDYNDNLPTGETHPLDWINFKDKSKDDRKVDKELGSNRNTIEMLLLRSDLSSEEVDTAMKILPAMEDFYAFLRQRREHDTAIIVKQILNHY